jgi:hypothetical protein
VSVEAQAATAAAPSSLAQEVARARRRRRVGFL